MAIAAVGESSPESLFGESPADDFLGPPEGAAPERVQPVRARNCRCADAEVKAYRLGADWICHTCGHDVSERASR
jgi:hypothetical protein